jgi:hypothetical protein
MCIGGRRIQPSYLALLNDLVHSISESLAEAAAEPYRSQCGRHHFDEASLRVLSPSETGNPIKF